MKQRGINRVTLAVWNLAKGKAFYAKLLGATFHPVHEADAAAHGIECAIAWDAGIELVAPLPERSSFVRKHLEKNGEGLLGAVFAVEDVDASKSAAEELGVRIVGALDYDQATIDRWLQGRFERYKEYFLAPDALLSPGLLIGEFIDSPRESSD